MSLNPVIEVPPAGSRLALQEMTQSVIVLFTFSALGIYSNRFVGVLGRLKSSLEKGVQLDFIGCHVGMF